MLNLSSGGRQACMFLLLLAEVHLSCRLSGRLPERHVLMREICMMRVGGHEDNTSPQEQATVGVLMINDDGRVPALYGFYFCYLFVFIQ